MRKLCRKVAAVVAITVVLGGVTEANAAANDREIGAEVVLRAVCQQDGRTPEDGTLTFVLWDEQFNILQMVVNLRQYAAFAPLHFYGPGRYVYYITQDGGSDFSIAYDAAVYQVVIEVTEPQDILYAEVTEVNRVKGDSVGEADVLEAFGAAGAVLFENRTREIPLGAEVPKTAGGTEVWLLLWIFSGVTLFLTVCGKKKQKS